MLRSILYLDDEARDNHVHEKFTGSGVQIHSFTEEAEAAAFLKTGESFDLVILDWLLDGRSYSDSLLFLAKLKSVRFVPVVLWTGVGDPLEVIAERKAFPKDLLVLKPRADVSADQLLEVVKQFHKENSAARLANQWRAINAKAIERTLYSLAEVTTSNIQSAVTGLADDEQDAAHPMTVLHQLLLRHISQDEQWNGTLAAVLQAGGATKPKATGDQSQYGRLVHLQRYFKRSSAKNVRTGDVVLVTPLGWKGDPFYGVVATPSCDLAGKKTRYIRVVPIRLETDVYVDKVDGNARGGSTTDRQWLPYLLPGKDGRLHHYFANFHDVRPLCTEKDSDGWSLAAAPPAYSDTYLLTGEKQLRCKVDYVISIDEPYQSSLLSRFSAHASRIGTPDVDKSVE